MQALCLATSPHRYSSLYSHTARIRSAYRQWWVQIRQGGQPSEGIEFHWDVDEEFCDKKLGDGSRTSLHVHPHLSTVSYLTDHCGAPTVIVHTRCPVAAIPTEIERIYGPVTGGAVSWPKQGKSIVFDGSKLHGAVPPHVPTKGQGCAAGKARITFLLNVWLGHRPQAIEPLPTALAQTLSHEWRPHTNFGAFETALAPPPMRTMGMEGMRLAGEATGQATGEATGEGIGQAQDGRTHEIVEVAFGRFDKVHALRLMLPPRPPPPCTRLNGPASMGAGDSRGVDSWQLVFEAGTAEIGPNTTGRLRCDRSGLKRRR
jgi:hypothetical protein